MKKNNWKYMMIVFIVITLLCLSIVVVYQDQIILPHKTMENKLNYSDHDLRRLSSKNSPTTIFEEGNLLLSNEQSDASELIDRYWWCAQSIVLPHDEYPVMHFTGVSIEVSRHGMPDGDLYIGLMHVASDMTDIDHLFEYCGFWPELIPEDTPIWLGFEFSEPVESINTLFLVVFTYATPDYPNNYWTWRIATDNPVDSGLSGVDCLYYYDFDYNHWDREDIWDCDGTYRIYAQEGGQEPPSISISSNTTVAIATYTGIISLLCAVVSGTKYKWF